MQPPARSATWPRKRPLATGLASRHCQDEEDGAKVAVKRRQSARNSGKRAAQEVAAKKAVEQAKHEDIAEGQQHSSHSTPTAVWMFGRAMESLLLPKHYSDDDDAKQSSPAAFFTIDHAERLMTLGSSKSSQSDRISFLAQLLLLPRTLGLNLTFIIITKSVLLEHTCKCNASGRSIPQTTHPPILSCFFRFHLFARQASTTCLRRAPSQAISLPFDCTSRPIEERMQSKR